MQMLKKPRLATKKQKKAKMVKINQRKRKELSLLKTLRMKESFNVINLKEDRKRLSARSLEWIIILKISSRLLPKSVKSLRVDVLKPQMRSMDNALPSKVMLNTIYGTSLTLIKN